MKLFFLIAVICVPTLECFTQIVGNKEIKGLTMCKQEAQIELKKIIKNYGDRSIPLSNVRIYCKELPQRWQVS